MARPTKVTKPRVQAILDAVRLGQPLMRAAAAGGINYDTFREWRAGNPEFSAALDAALAEGELYVLGRLHKAQDDGNVTAMLGWLERRFPDDWSRGERLKQEVSGTLGIRDVVREVQAALDAVVEDATTRRLIAEKLLALDTPQQQQQQQERSGQ